LHSRVFACGTPKRNDRRLRAESRSAEKVPCLRAMRAIRAEFPPAPRVAAARPSTSLKSLAGRMTSRGARGRTGYPGRTKTASRDLDEARPRLCEILCCCCCCCRRCTCGNIARFLTCTLDEINHRRDVVRAFVQRATSRSERTRRQAEDRVHPRARAKRRRCASLTRVQLLRNF